MFKELNKGNVEFNYRPKNADIFQNLETYAQATGDDLTASKIHVIHGFFFFDSEYGKSGAMVTTFCNVYIPKHMIEIFTEMVKYPDMIQAIKDNKCGFTLHAYKSHGKKCIGMSLEDIDDSNNLRINTVFNI